MRRVLPLALLAVVGCASSPAPEPKVVERIVYVTGPPCACEAPRHAKPARPHRGGAAHYHPHGKRHREPGAKRPHGVKGPKKKALRRCEQRPTEQAREKCRSRIARREPAPPELSR